MKATNKLIDNKSTYIADYNKLIREEKNLHKRIKGNENTENAKKIKKLQMKLDPDLKGCDTVDAVKFMSVKYGNDVYDLELLEKRKKKIMHVNHLYRPTITLETDASGYAVNRVETGRSWTPSFIDLI